MSPAGAAASTVERARHPPGRLSLVLPRDEALEQRIADMALARYGHAPRVEKYHSENNYVCRLRFEGSLPDRVVKVGLHLAGSVRQEAEALRRLGAAGMEVPEVEFTGDDVPEAGLTFFVMPHLGDLDLGRACAQGLEWADAACRRAGEFLARLQALPLALLDGFTLQHYRDLNTQYPGSRWKRLRGIVREHPGGQRLLEAVQARVEADLAMPRRVVTHESFIPAQVITDGADVFAVTDWETIRAGRSAQDVSCFGAGLLAWAGARPSHRDAFIVGFTGGAGLSPDDVVTVRAWEAHRLLWWSEFYLRTARDGMAEGLITEAVRTCEDIPLMPNG